MLKKKKKRYKVSSRILRQTRTWKRRKYFKKVAAEFNIMGMLGMIFPLFII